MCARLRQRFPRVPALPDDDRASTGIQPNATGCITLQQNFGTMPPVFPDHRGHLFCNFEAGGLRGDFPLFLGPALKRSLRSNPDVSALSSLRVGRVEPPAPHTSCIVAVLQQRAGELDFCIKQQGFKIEGFMCEKAPL